MKPLAAAFGLAATIALAGCATPPGPVEVTRFVAPERAAELGQGRIFVTTMPGTQGDSLALAPYKAAIASELAAIGYVESDRAAASQIAEVATRSPDIKKIRLTRKDLGPPSRRLRSRV